MKHYALTPQDAWFFRDGRPYNHGESNQADVHTQFPPPARTLTGAIRAALARANGWDGGRGRWPSAVTTAFGSSPHDLGQLQFSGPFLIHQGSALWPMPRHLLGLVEKGTWRPAAFLRPSADATMTDQGRRVLPEIAVPKHKRPAGLKPAETAWITTSGLTGILTGHLPPADSVHSSSTLWKLEPRVGLQRDANTLLVGEGNLYSPSFVRLHRSVALGIGITGLPAGMKDLPAWFPLGGESRLAQCEGWQGTALPLGPSAADFKPNSQGKIEFTLTLITPGAFDDLATALPGIEVMSACLGKPIPIGGWDSLKNEPIPLAPFHPAGSTWFCQATSADFTRHHAQHGLWLGDRSTTAHGFGQILIGLWPQLSQ
jgi:CRISPR-associated protein Cmr3